MNPLSDKDIDRLSREAAEQYDVDQNTSGWEKLEQKLNKHLPETGRKGRRWFLFFIWLLALVSGGGLLWMLTSKNVPELSVFKQLSSETELPVSKNTENDQLSTVDKNTPGNNDNKIDKPEQKRNNLGASTQNDKEAVKQETNTSVQEKMIGQNNAIRSTRKSNLRQKNAFGNDIVTTDNNNVKKKKNTPIALEPSFVQPSTEPLDKKEDENKTSGDNKQREDISSPLLNPSSPVPQNSNKLSADTAKQSISEQTKTDSLSTAVSKKVIAQKNKGSFQKGLEIGLVAAPDMSNVKFSNTDKVGFNVGIQLGYRLSQRWSINTGVLYTRKNYSSFGKDFNPPKGSWLDNVKLDKVDGNCFMFDIPLNVRYDLNENTNHRFFVNTGLSTYLMKKEDYHYYYQYPNGSPGYRYRSSPSTEQHWLSIINISAGFEKKLNNHFSLQAEPYLKIPLQGIGYGNLQLNSYGMYFSLKYKPVSRSGKK